MKFMQATLTLNILLMCSLRVSTVSHIYSTIDSHGPRPVSPCTGTQCIIPPSPSFIVYWIEMMGLRFDSPLSTLSSTVIDNMISSTPGIFSSFKCQPLKPKFIQHQASYAVILLLLAGDTEVNPGPRPIKYPCMVCKKPAKWGQNCLQCEECEEWFLIECMNLPFDDYQSYAQPHVTWLCSECGRPNTSNLPSIFDIHVSPGLLSNSFHHLEDMLSSDEEIGQPVASSSPTESVDPNRHLPSGRQNNQKLKVLNINCDGLYEKVPTLEATIERENPDIIIGTESHLKSHHLSAEVTPPGFVLFRRDRLVGGKGGIFVLVCDTLIATECNISSPNTELMWIEIHIQGSKPLIIGTFYRPPKSAASNLQQLADNIADIQVMYKNAILVVAGDFNLADINWTDRTVKPYANESSKCQLLQV